MVGDKLADMDGPGARKMCKYVNEDGGLGVILMFEEPLRGFAHLGHTWRFVGVGILLVVAASSSQLDGEAWRVGRDPDENNRSGLETVKAGLVEKVGEFGCDLEQLLVELSGLFSEVAESVEKRLDANRVRR